MNEPLTQALHTAEFTQRSLREALTNASAVEALILLRLLCDAGQLHGDIASLLSAKKEST